MAKARAVRDITAQTSYRRAAISVVAARADEVFAHAGGVLDVERIETVHDMRVATRRLRAVLEIFAPCFPAKRHRGCLRTIKALADALGERRDIDVQLAALCAFASCAPHADQPGLEILIAALREQQQRANALLAEAVDAKALSGLREQLDELLTVARAACPPAPVPLRLADGQPAAAQTDAR